MSFPGGRSSHEAAEPVSCVIRRRGYIVGGFVAFTVFTGTGDADAARACGYGGGRHRAGGGADQFFVNSPCQSSTPAGILAILLASQRWEYGHRLPQTFLLAS